MESLKETNLGVAQALLTPKGDHTQTNVITVFVSS